MKRLVVLLILGCSAALAAEPFSATVKPHKMTLRTGDHIYSVGDDGLIQPFGLRAQIVGTDAKGVGVWLTLKSLTEPKLLRDDARVKTVSGVWETTGGTPDYRLELELEVQAGLPSLTVRSRVRRVSEGGGDCYYYFGFGSQVTHYTVPGASAQEFQANEWQVLPHAKWVYISQKKSGEGVGIISDGRIGRAPATGEGAAPGETGAFPYLICTPKTATLVKGESLDVNFTLLATKSADEVAALVGKLRALTGDRIVFDARPFPRASLEAGHPNEARYTLTTGDGLAMSLSSAGQVADVSVGRKRLQPEGRTPLTGFFLRDHKARSAFTPVGGTLTKRAGGLAQTGRALNVALNATYTQRADRIDIAGELTDLTKTDRAISVYFALPVRNDRRWKWGDSIEQSRDVSPDEEYLTCATEQPFPAGANGLNSLYPFASLSGPAEIALGIPMDQPRVCRMTYCAETQQFFIVFDLALTEATANFPSKAGFSFSIFTFAPDWGFRACAKKYYTMFPQFFEKRVKRDGGWVCWGNVADVPNYGELGYAYHWGLSGPEACRWDNDHGLYAFPYIEATNMHQTMEEFTTATSEDVVKRLQWIADPNRKEPLPAWKYDHPYATFLGDRDKALRKTAAAYLKSLIYDPQGHIYGGASKTEFDLLIAKYIPCDANPYMPGGIGEFFLNEWLPKCQASMETKGGRTDGIAMDNFHCGDTALGRRREQFAWETIPLTFETSTGNPALVKNFTTYEWTNEAAKRLRPQGKFIIANTCTAQFPFTFQLLDIHGWEWGIQGVAPFARTIAYHKPVCSLPVQDAHKEEAWVKWHLRYGFFPGGYANSSTMLNRPAMVKYVPIIEQLQAAGWEPITGAWSSDPRVTLERFGSGRDGAVLLTVHSSASAATTATIKLDAGLLGLKGTVQAVEMVSGKTVPVKGNEIEITIGQGDTQVYRIAR
jgi:hypothetical protein